MKPEDFMAGYQTSVQESVFLLRQHVLNLLPEVTEQVDVPAKMMAYTYGQKYNQLVCVIIPSKKGVKLGFNQGASLPDPEKLLEGTGKISRYVVINSDELIQSEALKMLILSAYEAYLERMK